MGRPSKAKMEAAIRAHPGFESMHWEDDGCFQDGKGNDVDGLWVYFKEGYVFLSTGCGSAHEPTLTAVYNELSSVTMDKCYACDSGGNGVAMHNGERKSACWFRHAERELGHWR